MWKAKEGVSVPGARVTGSCETTSLGPLPEDGMFSPIEPSLQTTLQFFLNEKANEISGKYTKKLNGKIKGTILRKLLSEHMVLFVLLH